MQNDYPTHKLDPGYITRYIDDTKANPNYFKQLLSFKEYLEENNITQLNINDITTFVVINKEVFNNRSSMLNFWD